MADQQTTGGWVTLLEQQHDYTDEATWQLISDLATLPLGPGLQGLISITGSLTRRLRDLCGDAFRLQLLGERNRRDAPGLVREVIMLCGDRPWVFAQSVIPQSTLAANPWLRELGNRPLGDSLFERKDVVRDGLYLAHLPPGHALYERAVSDAGLGQRPDGLWARRSIVRIHEAALSINEVFFPDAGHCAKT